MRRRHWLPGIALFGLLAASFAAIAQPPATYRLTHICTTNSTNPVGGCSVNGMNNKGELVGSTLLSPFGFPQAAFIWREGEFIELNALLNTNFALASGINDRSDVVGEFEDDQVLRQGFLWRRGKISLIEIAPGRFASHAGSITNRREILVSAPHPQNVLEFFVWRERDGRLTPLEPLPGIPSNELAPLVLNNRGAVVGNGPGGPAGVLPLLWEDGTVMQIQLPQGALGGDAAVINDRGVITGVAIFPERFAAYRWQDGQATELPSTPNMTNNQPVDINNHGVIVGFSFHVDDEQTAATLWPRRGDPLDVNTLIADDDPLKPFVRLRSANLINERGQIVASGTDSRDPPFSNSHYLLTPQR